MMSPEEDFIRIDCKVMTFLKGFFEWIDKTTVTALQVVEIFFVSLIYYWRVALS
jgi:hypothetical protein